MSSLPTAPSSTESLTPHPGKGLTITVDKLGKKFNREWIFRNLTYTFLPGKPYAITGPNGSGKSTLLQILWGQMPASVGVVKYVGPTGEIAGEEIFKHIAIATPYQEIIDEFTLLEQLKFHFSMKAPRNGMSIVEMMDKMNLSHAQHKYISNFSSGMKQRVKLALAFFTDAAIFFLDEPGTNLDQTNFAWYKDQLHHLPSDALIFIASNQASEYPTEAQNLDIMRYK